MSQTLKKNKEQHDSNCKSDTEFKVLIVDDEPLIRRLMWRMLNKSGVVLLEATNYQSALEQVKASPQVIFLDIDFAGQKPNGIDALIHIRENGYTGSICMLTGDDSNDKLYKALLFGADDYILKGDKNFEPGLCALEFVKKVQSGLAVKKAQPFAWDCFFLKSKGLKEAQLSLLAEYTQEGFPQLSDLSAKLNVAEELLLNEFAQIEKQLGVKNNVELVRLLTIVFGYGARYRR